MTGFVRRVIWLVGAAVMVWSLSGCASDMVYSDSEPIDPTGWSMYRVVQFDAPVDTGCYSIDILVRSTEEYAYQNLWLFVETRIGNRILGTDTVQGFLSDNFGRRLGQGIGSKLTDYVALKDSVALADTTYTFLIRHGMRTDTLRGISDVGVTIITKSEE